MASLLNWWLSRSSRNAEKDRLTRRLTSSALTRRRITVVDLPLRLLKLNFRGVLLRLRIVRGNGLLLRQGWVFLLAQLFDGFVCQLPCIAFDFDNQFSPDCFKSV